MSGLAAALDWVVAAWRVCSAPVEQTEDEAAWDEQHWQTGW